MKRPIVIILAVWFPLIVGAALLLDWILRKGLAHRRQRLDARPEWDWTPAAPESAAPAAAASLTDQ